MEVIAKQFKPYQGATPDPAAATREAMAHARAGQIPLVEAFYSLQGEGMRTGQATVFVRMAGCNCDCWFCDTDFRTKELHTVDSLLAEIAGLAPECRWVCLTGGEPTIHDGLTPLCDALHARGYHVQAETNGSRPQPTWRLDQITVSPKIRQGARLDPWYLEHATEFKHVIDDDQDLELALSLAARHDKPVFLQPNALNGDAAQMCIDTIKQHPERLRLSLQTHKLLSIR